jgi:4-alpha-glucanotransferase
MDLRYLILVCAAPETLKMNDRSSDNASSSRSHLATTTSTESPSPAAAGSPPHAGLTEVAGWVKDVHAAHRRRMGVLQPLFSLRTERGWGLGEIGDLGAFCRWAGRAGLSVVQLLPVNELTEGETSPYSAATAFALDPVYLSLDDVEDFVAMGGRAALPAAERAGLEALNARPRVAWAEVRAFKQRAIERAFSWFLEHEWRTNSARAAQLRAFVETNRAWLPDYALFRVLHDQHQVAWWDWPAALAQRQPDALLAAQRQHEAAILRRHWVEWQLDIQWTRARAEARAAGVALKGDLPFMVAGDSADVWADPLDFRRDRRVGTAPDAFSDTGQDWGLPAYDWDAMRASDFRWFEARAARAGSLYDLFRVDHVIGLFRTYSRAVADPRDAGFFPAREEDQIALGHRLLDIFKKNGEVVAEDLGWVPAFLPAALQRLEIPGYRVLRWEKDHAGTFRDPASYPALSVATTGTHDVEPVAVWYDALGTDEKKAFHALPGLHSLPLTGRFDAHVRDAILRLVVEARSELALFPFEDLFGARDRVNVPGTVSPENWTNRMASTVAHLESDTDGISRLHRLATTSRRIDVRSPGQPVTV